MKHSSKYHYVLSLRVRAWIVEFVVALTSLRAEAGYGDE